MNDSIIEVKGIGKKYQITHESGRYLSLRDVMTNILKSPFRYAKTRAKKAVGLEKKEEFWALTDIDFTVKKNDVIGIIGRNGAGKSTLLKVLSQITPPTTGEIRIRGRIGSILEVGTGFHPELTGRENILLNGAILGMTKKEISKKFDEIVKFAGVNQFLDTPVKHYSSGMYVRLAFSVAAHMEPDILIVDEVLAVGDADFQKKCLGKMDDIHKKEGRVILFVSHNMAAVQNLCQKTIWLEKGRIKKIGKTSEVIDAYLANRGDIETAPSEYLSLKVDDTTGKIRLVNTSITNDADSPLIQSGDRLKITMTYDSDFRIPIPDMRVLITISSDRSGNTLAILDNYVTKKNFGDSMAPQGAIICETDPFDAVEGRYLVEIHLIPQREKRFGIKILREFNVMTDNSKYDYSLNPDKERSDYLHRYSFRQQ